MPKKRRKHRKKKKESKKTIYIFLIAVIVLFALYYFFNNRLKVTSIPEKESTKIDVKKLEKNETVLDALDHARTLLGVPENLFKTRIKDDIIDISIALDKAEMDLNYANMIITGQVEMIGGEVRIGKELYSGSMQILEIYDPENKQEFKIKLYYAKEGYYQQEKIKLAIVVDDFGYSGGKLLEDFCALDKNITFAILPGLNFSKNAMIKANATGHETMIHIPMEPINYPRNDPGSNAIFVHLSKKEIRKKIENFIKELPLCVGANNHMGSLATADKEVMTVVLEVLKKHNMYFIDSHTTSSTVAYDTAQRMMVPSFDNDFFLDTPDISDETLSKKIQKLHSLEQNKVLIITHCTSRKKLEYLKKFLTKIENMNYELVPVSSFFKTDLPEIL